MGFCWTPLRLSRYCCFTCCFTCCITAALLAAVLLLYLLLLEAFVQVLLLYLLLYCCFTCCCATALLAAAGPDTEQLSCFTCCFACCFTCFFTTGGYERIVQGLSEGLDIRLNSPVTRVVCCFTTAALLLLYLPSQIPRDSRVMLRERLRVLLRLYLLLYYCFATALLADLLHLCLPLYYGFT